MAIGRKRLDLRVGMPERIAEKFPLVKELKNRLNLDLDY